jgi:hypothetical protein
LLEVVNEGVEDGEAAGELGDGFEGVLAFEVVGEEEFEVEGLVGCELPV